MTRDAINSAVRPATDLARILVVDDDEGTRVLLTRYLEHGGFAVQTAGTAHEALVMFSETAPDLVLLDVMLAADDGLDVLAQIRKGSDVPVILLTARTEEADRIMGLRLGADDYVVKPFSPAEVEARITSVLRRTKPSRPPVLRFDGLSIELETREVRAADSIVALTAMEFDLLAFLASSPRQVFSREQLLDHVWHSSSAWQSTDTVTEHIRRLRKRVESDPDNPRWISTVWGVGYRFNP